MDPTLGIVAKEGSHDPLPRLKKALESEYEDVPDAQVEEVAKHALGKLEGARIREFVPILAWRHARDHLRKAS